MKSDITAIQDITRIWSSFHFLPKDLYAEVPHSTRTMHILADTWAHYNFAGTPSLVINNTDNNFSEIMDDGSVRPISFKHSPGASDDIENAVFNSTVFNLGETNILRPRSRRTPARLQLYPL